jgi:colanic acid biosynthesis glycosyl transferase WcaI
MKVVFVNRFFHPDISATSQILTDLAFHLASSREVHVVTSRLTYDRVGHLLPKAESIGGVHVHRVWTSGFGRSHLMGRACDYLTFYFAASVRLFGLLERGDTVVAMTDPPLISVPAGFVASLKGSRVVNWLQDVFPEAAEELGFRSLRGPLGSVLKRMRDRSLRRATRNVALGQVMAERLAASGVYDKRIRVVHNWSQGEQVKPLDPSTNRLRHEWGLENRFVVGYSGNMGRAHDLAPLLEAASLLRDRGDIVFLLIGAGNQRQALEDEVRGRGLGNVVFKPYQAREMLGLSLTVPDCHVVSLKPALEGLIVPSKLYSSLAAGRPVLFLGSPHGEIGTLLRSHPPFGICIDGSPAEIAGAVIQLCDNRAESRRMGENGRRLYENEFDAPIALAKWSAVLAETNSGA